MKEIIEVWNIFHDGSIVEIKGSLPDVSIRIEISYLRNMFPGKGDSIWVHLIGCSTFEYLIWEEERKTSSLDEIQSFEPEILSVKEHGEMAHIICVEGELDLIYKRILFSLDTDTSVTIAELDKACNKYWDEWGNQTNS